VQDVRPDRSRTQGRLDPPVPPSAPRRHPDRDRGGDSTTTSNHKGEHMALIEKALADDLVDLRQQQALGTEYVPIGDLIAAKQAHLEREQWWRGQMGRMAEMVEATS
jgi:hypothetical protein